MAEINNATAGKRRSLRVDLTPMVDLGFLLISFFIFTTTLSAMKEVRFYLPADGPPVSYGASTSLTLVPAANNRVWYFDGTLDEESPAIIAMQRASATERAMIVHAIENGSTPDMAQIVAVVKATGALDATRSAAAEQAQEAIDCLRNLPQNAYTHAMVQLASQLLSRRV